MEPAATIAIAVTVVLVLFALFSAAIGVAVWCIEATRFLGPFVTCIPVLALLGAASGSWGLGFLVASFGSEYHGQAWWAWLAGLPSGGIIGGLLGWWLASQCRRNQANILF